MVSQQRLHRNRSYDFLASHLSCACNAVGKVEPLKRAASGSGALQLVSALAGLFAGGSAQAAAGEAAHAADTAQQTAAVVAPDAALAATQPPATPDSLREAGVI